MTYVTVPEKRDFIVQKIVLRYMLSKSQLTYNRVDNRFCILYKIRIGNHSRYNVKRWSSKSA